MIGREPRLDDDRMRVVDLRSSREAATRGFRSVLRSRRRGEPRPSTPGSRTPGSRTPGSRTPGSRTLGGGFGHAATPAATKSRPAARKPFAAFPGDAGSHPIAEALDRRSGPPGEGDPTNPTARSVELTPGRID